MIHLYFTIMKKLRPHLPCILLFFYYYYYYLLLKQQQQQQKIYLIILAGNGLYIFSLPFSLYPICLYE